MHEATRIKKNSVYSFLSISSRLIANVIVFWILARYYGPKSYGQFTFAHALATTFILFADFGFDILLTTEVARDRNNAPQIFQQFFSVKFVFTLASLSGMWLFSLFSNFSVESRTLIFIFSLYMVFTTLTNFLNALYKGFEKLEYETRVSLFINVALLILIIIFIIVKASLIVIGCGFVLTRVLGFAVGIKYSYNLLPHLKYKPKFKGVWEKKNKIFVFGFHFLFSYLFFQLDTILLALWKGEYAVGIYQAVFKLIMLPLVIPEVLINVLMPALSRLNVENQIQWKKIGYLMSKVLLIIVIPISIILYVFANQVINIIYGPKIYADSIPILRIFALILFIRFTLEPFALMLTTSNRQNIRLYVVLSATILNVILNYFIIPVHGAYGAAIVSLITNIFVCVSFYLFTLPLYFEWYMNIRTLTLIIISLILGFILWSFNSVSVFIVTPLLSIVFLIIAYYYYFTIEERKYFLVNEFKKSILKFKI